MTFSSVPPPVVVDASVAIDRLEGAGKWRLAFEQWAAEDRLLLTPVGFLAEVGNALMLGRQRLSAAAAHESIELLLESGIEPVDRGVRGLFAALELSERHGLTVYDALYLQLVVDIDGELATEDAALRAAAIAEEVSVVD